MRPFYSAVLAGGLLLPCVTVDAAPVDLLSHRAAYRLSLAENGSTSAFVSVRGALVMEWRATCEGWLSTQQLGFVAQSAEGGAAVSYDVRFSSWESTDNTAAAVQPPGIR